MMAIRFGCVLSLGLIVSGCDRKSESAAGAEPTAAPSVVAEPATAEPATAAAASDSEIPDGPYPDRDSALAHRLVEQHGALLLDVRTPKEFDGGHIEGAHNIPHDSVAAEVAQIESLVGGDKTKPIVVYCRSGHRAGLAKEELVKLGYERVTNLGGISDW